MKVLSIKQAIEALANGLNEEQEGIGLDNAKTQVYDSMSSDQASVLLIDASLL